MTSTSRTPICQTCGIPLPDCNCEEIRRREEEHNNEEREWEDRQWRRMIEENPEGALEGR